MSANKKRLLNFLLLFALCMTLVFIWGNSMLDGEESAELSNGVLYRFSSLFSALGLDTEDDLWLRKLAHFCEFGLLGLELACLSVLNFSLSLKTGLLSFSFAVLAAFADETIQLFSGRYSHIHDVMLDCLGAACGLLFVFGVYSLSKRSK